MNANVGLALIAGLFSLIVAVASAYFTYENNKRTNGLNAELAKLQADLNKDLADHTGTVNKQLEEFKNNLGDNAAEKQARRDYQYEARKRLYEEVEPLLFQIVERADSALGRIRGLARTAGSGDLGPGGWLSTTGRQVDDYYRLSTIYRLMTPLVVVRLIQNRITLVDLTVDHSVRLYYVLGKRLYVLFTEDFTLAQQEPKIEYNPYRVDAESMSVENPKQYKQQGIVSGRLDNMIEALTTRDADDGKTVRCMTFGEFESTFADEKSAVYANFVELDHLARDFHPATSPVLWRILIAQAFIYQTLIDTYRTRLGRKADLETSASTKDEFRLADLDSTRFDWRHNPNEATDDEVLRDPFAVAKAYICDRLQADGVSF
jgi:hypothetical protein